MTTGDKAPARVDALVTYADKWMWDITMYMLELTDHRARPEDRITRSPTGNSYHTSLTPQGAARKWSTRSSTTFIKEGKAK